MTAYQNILLGGALGDSLGANVEFLSYEEIVTYHGPLGVHTLIPAYGRLGAITDDTQMTLFTAEGLMQVYLWQQTSPTATLPSMVRESMVVGNAYHRWYRTQTEAYYPKNEFHEDVKGLLAIPELFSRRAPGNTCMSALKVWPDTVINNSKGCGTVMRTAPVALYAHTLHYPHYYTFRLAAELGNLTHKHPSAGASAGLFSVILQMLLEGHSLREAVRQVIRDGRQWSLDTRFSGHEKLVSLEPIAMLETALRLSETPFTHEKMESLGLGSWVSCRA